MADSLFTSLCVEMLEGGHAVRFQAPGTSMYPAIRDGEWMIVAPVRPASVRRGDVVLYRSVRGLTAHRVVRVVGDKGAPARFVVRGDNAGALDEHVDSRHILGRVAHVERGRGRFDPASMRAQFACAAWRTVVALRRKLHGLVAASRLSLPAKRWQVAARQGGSS